MYMEIDTEDLISWLKSHLKSVPGRADSASVRHPVSIVFPRKIHDFYGLLSKIDDIYSTSFISYLPETGAIVAGFGEVNLIATHGPDRFDRSGRWIEESFGNLASHTMDQGIPEIPRVYGCVSFFDEFSDEVWDDYAPALWIYPEIIISRDENTALIAYQFQAADRPNHIINRFNKILKLIDSNDITADKSSGIYTSPQNGSSDEDRKSEWIDRVEKSLEYIRKGEVEKIVLSRRVELQEMLSIRPAAFLKSLVNQFSNCYNFILKRKSSVFVGASPELFISLGGRVLKGNAVGGSIRRGNDQKEDLELEHELLRSRKESNEHRYVADHVHEVLAAYCTDLESTTTPGIKKLPNIQHLVTEFRGNIKEKKDIFKIMDQLHPTPAVGGVPRIKALDLIRKLEVHDRGLYSGFLGWLTPDLSGEFFVALRSALIRKGKLYAFAGAGIVQGSDPQAEYIETENKLQAIKSLLQK